MQHEQPRTLVCPKCGTSNIVRAMHQTPMIAEIVLDGQACPVWEIFRCMQGHEFVLDVA